MSKQSEDGYVLAGMLALLLAMSLVAAGFVMVSSSAVRQVRASEAATIREFALQGAILLAGARAAESGDGETGSEWTSKEAVQINSLTIEVYTSLESDRLDLNRTEALALLSELENAGVPAEGRQALSKALLSQSAPPDGWALSSDLPIDAPTLSCVDRWITVFGGRPNLPDAADDGDAPVRLRQLPAGVRLRVEAFVAGDPDLPGVRGVLLMTGAKERPFRLLDLRSARQRDDGACDATAK